MLSMTLKRRLQLGAGILLLGVCTSLLANDRLISTAREADTEGVRRLLADGVNPDSRHSDGSTALIWAAHNNDLATVRLLLEAGADPLATNDYGISALSRAALNGNAAMLQAFLERGVDPDTLDRNGETALMTAAKAGSLEALQVLLEHGADVNRHEQWRGQTALMWAAAEDHAEVVSVLIDHGADIDAVSREFDYRDLAVKPGSVAMNFPRGGLTPLLFAARNGSLASAQALIDAGADIDMTDPDNTSPLLMSIINFNYDIAMLLLESRADVNVADSRGRTALYAAVDMRRLDTSNRPVPLVTATHTPLDVISNLLEVNGLVIDAPLSNHLRPRAVLDGADRTLTAGATPFMRAARSGDRDVMTLLLAAGADPHRTLEDGTTSLMIAAGEGWRDGKSNNTLASTLDAVQICLEAGVDINAHNEKGVTALHSAASRGADQAIRMLVAGGADLGAEDEEGATPLDRAKSVGGKVTPLHSTVELLETLMAVR